MKEVKIECLCDNITYAMFMHQSYNNHCEQRLLAYYAIFPNCLAGSACELLIQR